MAPVIRDNEAVTVINVSSSFITWPGKSEPGWERVNVGASSRV